jgi:hypothetical protein
MPIDNIDQLFSIYKSDKQIYHDLMAYKITEILLVATLYDAFNLEQEGQLTEQIFEEYYQLNLSSAPRITNATSSEQALEYLSRHHYDLVILMAGVDTKSPVQLAATIREFQPRLPLVLLINNNSIIAEFKQFPNNTAHFNSVFVWNGYSNTLLAIVKHIEDTQNVARDTRRGNVRVILLVEDSIRYYSRYLGVLYTEVIKQSSRVMLDESASEIHKLMRMRARPKVLLARTFEEAIDTYEAYKENLLCLISDARFSRLGVTDPEAGLRLIAHVKGENPDLPVLLQSSESNNRHKADASGSVFIDKNSDNLVHELRGFFLDNLGFGRFIFRNAGGQGVATCNNMQEFEDVLRTIPQESLFYHASRNHFSAWLMARGEIRLATHLRKVGIADFKNLEELRTYLLGTIESLRQDRTRGQIIPFDESHVGSSSHLVRLAHGSIGGKGRGISFICNLIENMNLGKQVSGVKVKIPATSVIGIDEFNTFLDHNNLSQDVYRTRHDEELKKRFASATLSEELTENLTRFLSICKTPLAIRSSGLFEDMLLKPFSGIYETFLIPNNARSRKERLAELCLAIKMVYASVFSTKARAYFDAVGYKIEEEKMAVIIQEVVGQRHDRHWFPHISGVANSYNYYPVSYLKPEDGVCMLALGLGTYVADGEKTLRFSPSYPKLDIVSMDHQMQSSQHHFYTLNLDQKTPNLLEGEDVCYARLELEEAERFNILGPIVSTYDSNSHSLVPGASVKGPRIVNFANILKHDQYPLAQIIDFLLKLTQKAMSTPVEIEFAVDLNKDQDGDIGFYLLQLKPLLRSIDDKVVIPKDLPRESLLLYTSRGMGNGRIGNIHDIVYIDPGRFKKTDTAKMAEEVGYFNEKLKKENRKYLLIGPGRWGTRDPWIGIPVNFVQISNAQTIVETALPDFQIDASLGSHFYHNITSMNIGYFTVPLGDEQCFIDWAWLESQPAEEKRDYAVHLRLEHPITIIMDGRRGLSMISKPGQAEGTAPPVRG